MGEFFSDCAGAYGKLVGIDLLFGLSTLLGPLQCGSSRPVVKVNVAKMEYSRYSQANHFRLSALFRGS